MSGSSNSRDKYRTPTPPGGRQGNPLAVDDDNENRAERQRELPTGASDEDSDREEAAAQLEANDDDIKMEVLPETEQTPLLAIGNGDGEEPTPQLVNGDAYTAMSLDPPIVEAAEAADADTDMATDLPENIVDA